MPGKPHQLLESMLEIQWAMEPLTSFTDAEVLDNSPPSNWVKIMSSWGSDSTDPPTSWEQSHSRSHRAQARGTFVVAHCIGWSKPTATTWVVSPSVSLTLKVELQQEDTVSQRQTPSRVCRNCEIYAWGQPTMGSHGCSPELAKEQEPIRMAGYPMFFIFLFQDSMSGATYINIVTCSMSLVGLGSTSSAVDCSIPTLLGKEDMDSD